MTRRITVSRARGGDEPRRAGASWASRFEERTTVNRVASRMEVDRIIVPNVNRSGPSVNRWSELGMNPGGFGGG